MIEIYQHVGEETRRAAPRSRVRVARIVYVTDSIEEAKRDLRDIDLGTRTNRRVRQERS